MKKFTSTIVICTILICFLPTFLCEASLFSLSTYSSADIVNNRSTAVVIEGSPYYLRVPILSGWGIIRFEIFDSENNIVETVDAVPVIKPGESYIGKHAGIVLRSDYAWVGLDNLKTGLYNAVLTMEKDETHEFPFEVIGIESFSIPIITIKKYFYDIPEAPVNWSYPAYTPDFPIEYGYPKSSHISLIENDKYCINIITELEATMKIEIFNLYGASDEPALQTHRISTKMNNSGIYEAVFEIIPPVVDAAPHYRVQITTLGDERINTSVKFELRYEDNENYSYERIMHPPERYLDVDITDPLYENLAKLARLGVLGCFTDDYFYPDKVITRAEYAYMLAEAFDVSMSDEDIDKIAQVYNIDNDWLRYNNRHITSYRFNDLDNISWYYQYVCEMTGYMFDVNGEFLPDAGAQRWDIMVTLLNMHNPAYTFNSQSTEGWYLSPDYASEIRAVYSDIPSGWWIDQYIWLAYTYGFMDGYPDGTFRFDEFVTRAEAVMIISRILELQYCNLNMNYQQ